MVTLPASSPIYEVHFCFPGNERRRMGVPWIPQAGSYVVFHKAGAASAYVVVSVEHHIEERETLGAGAFVVLESADPSELRAHQ